MPAINPPQVTIMKRDWVYFDHFRMSVCHPGLRRDVVCGFRRSLAVTSPSSFAEVLASGAFLILRSRITGSVLVSEISSVCIKFPARSHPVRDQILCAYKAGIAFG